MDVSRIFIICARFISPDVSLKTVFASLIIYVPVNSMGVFVTITASQITIVVHFLLSVMLCTMLIIVYFVAKLIWFLSNRRCSQSTK